MMWVNPVSRQGDGTYTVIEADSANNDRGATVAGCKMPAAQNSSGGVPTTALMPMAQDFKGDWVIASVLPTPVAEYRVMQVATVGGLLVWNQQLLQLS